MCRISTNSLNKFFSSVIARLNAVRDDGGNIREAYEAILLGEEGMARRMPSDAEFERRSGRAAATRSSAASICSPRSRTAGTRRTHWTSRAVPSPSSISCRRMRLRAEWCEMICVAAAIVYCVERVLLRLIKESNCAQVIGPLEMSPTPPFLVHSGLYDPTLREDRHESQIHHLRKGDADK